MTSAPLTFDADLNGLNLKVQDIQRVFASNGADDALMATFVKQQASALAADIAVFLPPSSQQAQGDQIRKDVERQMAYRDMGNLLFDEGRQGKGDMKWIAAGPTFLVGVKESDNYLDSSESVIFTEFKKRRSLGSPGKKYLKLKKRGKQSVERLNRMLVHKSAIAATVLKVMLRAGRAKASFASAAIRLGSKRRFGGWVTSKIKDVESDGKAIFDDSALIGPRPEIHFGSAVPGLIDNPAMANAINAAVAKRESVADKTLKKLLDGFIYNVNTGQIYKAKEVGDDE